MGSNIVEERITTTALVVEEPGAPFVLRQITLQDLRPDEILVRMVATGVCHTDFASTDGTIPVPTPVVVGHEGSGIVEKVGSGVKHLVIGDHVLLTYPACMSCSTCLRGSPAYCVFSPQLCFGGSRLDGTTPFSLGGKDVHYFFGQSSFAHRSIVNSVCAIKIDKEVPLDIISPLGCGLQTGAGTILNVLKPAVGSSVAIFGVGPVGLAGIIAAANFTSATKIIAVDIVQQKLDLAKELGATHVINSKEQDVKEVLKTITGGEGVNYAYDTTGNKAVVEIMISTAANNATVATVGGAPVGRTVEIEIASWIGRGIHYTGSCQGSSVPQLFLPALIELWKQGRFPVERLIKYYHYSDINKVKEAMRTGDCIKAVLYWDESSP